MNRTNRTLDTRSGHVSVHTERDVDYLNHVSTLSAGSLIVIAIFLQKLFATNPLWTPVVAAAVAGLIVSVIAAVITLTAVVTNPARRGNGVGNTRLLITVAGTVMWGGFLVSMTTLAAIAL
jgi:hypothetical protein